MNVPNSQAQRVLWIHADALSPHNPAFALYPGAPAVFVWDDALLREWAISLKRIQFIYECLLELPVTIRRGDVPAQVAAFAAAHGAARVVTVETPAPRFRQHVAKLRGLVPVEIVKAEPFFEYDGTLDLGRFSRYWRVAERHVFDE
jgi:hypothetical protein